MSQNRVIHITETKPHVQVPLWRHWHSAIGRQTATLAAKDLIGAKCSTYLRGALISSSCRWAPLLHPCTTEPLVMGPL